MPYYFALIVFPLNLVSQSDFSGLGLDSLT